MEVQFATYRSKSAQKRGAALHRRFYFKQGDRRRNLIKAIRDEKEKADIPLSRYSKSARGFVKYVQSTPEDTSDIGSVDGGIVTSKRRKARLGTKAEVEVTGKAEEKGKGKPRGKGSPGVAEGEDSVVARGATRSRSFKAPSLSAAAKERPKQRPKTGKLTAEERRDQRRG